MSLASTANEIQGLSSGRGRISKAILDLATAISQESCTWAGHTPLAFSPVLSPPPCNLGMLQETLTQEKEWSILLPTDSLIA